jgi:oligopeptide/dipeptide ABC transporter ATP-binding protein
LALLEVENLRTEFRSRGAVVEAVRGVSFRVERGETVGVVGESGSGKSVTALSVMGLVPKPPGYITGGSVRLDGKDLLIATPREMRQIRGAKIAMVFQDPFSCLNPTMTLGEQVAEPIRLHKRVSKCDARERALGLLRAVRIPSPEIRYGQYPHEISGGQRQRVMIAMAFACSPDLLIADEPTTALDVTVQAQILALMAEMQKKTETGILLITHDIGVVAESCDRVLVMYAGQIVESGSVEQVLGRPKHPYTQGLLESLPQLGGARRRLASIPGQPPDLAHLPPGCPFTARCPRCMPEICPTREPEPTEPEPGQKTRCFLYGGRC